jgi:hypothetical protein
MTVTTCLNYLHSTLLLRIRQDDYPLIRDVLDFFATYFQITKTPKNNPLAELCFYPLEEYDSGRLHREGKFIRHTIMRTSTAEEFSLDSKLYRVGNHLHYLCHKTGTNLVFDHDNRSIQVYLGKSSKIQLIELIRDLIVKNEESNGTLILHASAVLLEGVSYVIVGGKGAGKTTLLLEFLTSTSARLIAGDRLFLTLSDGALTLNGWPDYPHLGAGTIARFPGIRSLVKARYQVDVDTLPLKKKILIDPLLFAQKLGLSIASQTYPFNICLFPQFAPGQPCRLIRYDTPAIDQVVENLMFSSDYWQTKWHRFIVPDYSKKQQKIDRLRHHLQPVRFLGIKGDFNLNSILKEVKAC